MSDFAYGYVVCRTKKYQKDILNCIKQHGLVSVNDPVEKLRIQFFGDRPTVLCVLMFLKYSYPIGYVCGGTAPKGSEYTSYWDSIK